MADGIPRRVDALCVHLPSPPGRDVYRDYAGGFGVALPSGRTAYGHGVFTQPCLSLLYAAAALKNAGMKVAYIDGHAERLTVPELEERVHRLQPTVLLMFLNLPSLYSDLAIVSRLRRLTTATTVVMGTVCRADELLQEILDDESVDVAITGDPEVVAVPLVDAVLAGRGLEVEGTAVRSAQGRAMRRPGGELSDLDSLPDPPFELLPMRKYVTWEFGRRHSALGKELGGYRNYFPLYLSRGCPYSCSYCPYPIGVGRRWRHKSVEHVVDEMSALAATGTRSVILRDQTLGEDLGYLHRVCEGMLRRGLDMQWLCESRPGSLPADVLALMRRAGCVRVHYGVETGDADTFASQAKRGIAPDVVDRCLAQTERAGILPSLHFLVGFPEDTWRTVSATLALIERCRVKAGDCSLMTPYPGTRHYDLMREQGRILVDSWDAFTGTDPIVAVDGLSPVELVTARWRILSAIEGNSNRGLRSRLGDSIALLRAGSGDRPGGPRIDSAIQRAVGMTGGCHE